VDKTLLFDGQFSTWASEGLSLAIDDVYPGVVAGQSLSDDYVEQASEILKSRIMYGGYRLSNLLKSIYSPADAFLQ
jgi:hypothetical protein